MQVISLKYMQNHGDRVRDLPLEVQVKEVEGRLSEPDSISPQVVNCIKYDSGFKKLLAEASHPPSK